MDPAKMKVVDLRSELGALGLDTKGNKPALVERLKKALEAKTGITIVNSSILDTSTEDADEPSTPVPATPRRSAAARTTRRSSSSRLAATPVKVPRDDPPKPIEEESKDDEDESNPLPPAPVPEPIPEPVPEPEQKSEEPETPPETKETPKEDLYSIDDQSQSPVPEKTESDDQEEIKDTDSGVPVSQEQSKEEIENNKEIGEDKEEKEEDKEEEKDEEKEDEKDEEMDQDSKDRKFEEDEEEKERQRELTEEEEWKQLNQRLIQKEQERIEREKKQAEEDAKRFEEFSKDPVKLQRLKRKQEKKARWSNFYKSIEVTNEVLAPHIEEPSKDKKESSDQKGSEPELDDNKITLSWYDSDLNQYLEVPELASVVALSEGAFAHAWAGARASHGVLEGRVCYEVRVGSVVTTTESAEKETIASGLRVGWSTDDSNLHLGEGELSWGFESTGRAVNNSEFKEYGKQFSEKDVIGVYLDLESNPCKISYTLNGLELGTAFEFEKDKLQGKIVYPHILTKNTCYRVNFGYDRYNMLTRTKIVRKRLEIPVEQVLEEKRKREEEIRKQKEETARKDRERRDKERKDREERMRKKREERERERKEKESQEKKDKAEEMEVDAEKKDTENEPNENENEKEKEKDVQEEVNNAAEEKEASVEEKKEEPKENGEKQEEQAAEVKTEPMETDEKSVEKESTDIKEETSDEVQEVTEEEVLTGYVLDKRIKFVIRYTVEEELDGSEACLLPGHVLLAAARTLPGPRRPAAKHDCEVILMVGMPGAGKTYWAKKHCEEHPERRYNILSTGAIFDKMKVDCKPFRSSFDGKWDAMVSKCAKCVLRLLEIAKGRRRNYILDQTNVYPSAQRRKLREFDGYRRVAVCVVVADAVQRERSSTREAADGKEVPDPAVLDMKANFSLPEVSSWLDEVIYPELPEEEAKKVVEGYHQEAAAAGAVREKDKRSRSASRGRDGPPIKRQRSQDRDRRGDYRRRDHPREREDRWGGGGGGGGGGGSGGGGSRWSAGGGARGRWGRERGGMAPGPRFDRGWGAPPGRNDYSRERDNFRGGRGGPAPRQDRGPLIGGPTGPGGPGSNMGPRGPNDRFQRDNRPNRAPHQGDKRPPPQGGNQGSAGTWQRGSSGQQQPRGPRPNQQLARQGQGQGQDGQNQTMNQNQNQNPNQNQNQNQNQNPNQNQSWNQWAGGWGGWGNWNNQNQGWNNWNNWGGWGNQQQQGSGGGGGGSAGGQQGGNKQQQQQQQQQWPNYTAQQWYQWQQWQQQQQGWQGYNPQQQPPQQQGAQPAGANAADAAQAWAQYYQSYGGANMGNTNSSTAIDKK